MKRVVVLVNGERASGAGCPVIRGGVMLEQDASEVGQPGDLVPYDSERRGGSLDRALMDGIVVELVPIKEVRYG